MRKLLLSFCLIFMAAQLFAQQRTVTGVVKDKVDSQPLPGVSVILKGTRIGTQTDENGKFTLKIPANANPILTFAYVGYSSTEQTVGTSNNLIVSLASDSRDLDEVVITAGGVNIQRRQQGNQSTTIKGSELTQAKAFNVASGLTGKVAGLQINAVSSGVNPNVRLVLRGNRSLLGNNQALVVVDNVIAPNSILGNLNPEDIEDVQVLNGSGAAALYGSDASNGALIITTKKGKAGQSTIRASNTTNLEQVSFLPKLQSSFGSGTGPDDVPSYTPYENQQYGPAFDGSLRVIGKPLQDGSIQTVPYSPSSENKNNFWKTGITNQTDVSISSGDEKSTTYFAGQYLSNKSTVPYDKYTRFSLRVNGTRKINDQVNITYNTNYIQNRFDVTSQTAQVFDNVLQSPGQIPLTRYKNWQTDPFANPNGYYNEYYQNPYFTLQNNRNNNRNDYLSGNAEINWNPYKPLKFLFRAGITSRNNSNKSYQGKFNYSEYTTSISGGSKTPIAGGVSDGSLFITQINSDFISQYNEKFGENFSLDALVGASLRDNSSKFLNSGISGLVIPGLYNQSNTLNNLSGSESNFRARQLGVYADARLGYRNYLYLHVTGRNDWRSILAPENRSFFYPSADISFIASDAIPALKESTVLQSLKIRGGVSQVGQVSLGDANNFGAYSLLPTFGQGFGYPFTSGAGYTLSNQIVAPSIKPEKTLSYEAGFDADLYKGRITASLTLYKSNTRDQTVPVLISNATGFGNYLTNTGEVENRGIESVLRLTPVRTSYGLEVTMGANYTLNKNKVLSIASTLPQLNLGGSGNVNVVARAGLPFPYLSGTQYVRDPQGRIIVDRVTGYPSVTQNFVNLGQTEPVHRLGLDATVTFKGIRFATLFEYRTGNVIYNSTGSFDFSGAGIRTTFFNRDRFVVPNSSYEDPNNPGTYIANTNITTRSGGTDFWTDGPRNLNVAENYTYSAAFWKLREASISYDIPVSVFAKTKFIKGANISFQGRNLFVWVPKTNLYTDPEYSAFGSDSNAIGVTTLGQTPPSRFYGGTVSLTF